MERNCVGFKWLMVMAASVAYAFFSFLTADVEVGDSAQFRPAVAILAFSSAVYGPLSGFLIGFLGNVGVDFLLQDIWWHWSAANGMIGLMIGLLHMVPGYQPERGRMQLIHLFLFLLLVIVGNYAGLTLAALFDIILQGVPFHQAIYGWAISPATSNVLACSILGTPLLYGYVALKRYRRVSSLAARFGKRD
ncbi:MAG: ECF transporter S component [Brevibacillus sp.]|nr:ECF transporter S component [Brevibacillus sp.]